MIAVIDMGMGNLQSVCWACKHIGAPVTVASEPKVLEAAQALILPGVGAFGDGMRNLRHRGFVEVICRQVKAGKPLLGICLGMQLLAEEGEEYGVHQGLGLIHGRVVRLTASGTGERVPNIGWCDVTITNPASMLFANIPSGSSFYFAHSYYVACEHGADVTATIAFGSITPPAAIQHGNVYGVQFHPEKSQDVGLELLYNFWRRATHNS